MINYQLLRDWIMQSAACSPYIVQNSDPKQDASAKDAAIADLCNSQGWAREITEEYVTIPSLMSGLGAIQAASILDKLEVAAKTNSVLKWAMYPLTTERGLNVGDPETRLRISGLAGLVLTQAEVDAVNDLANKPIPVTAADVSIALRGNAQFTPGI